MQYLTILIFALSAAAVFSAPRRSSQNQELDPVKGGDEPTDLFHHVLKPQSPNFDVAGSGLFSDFGSPRMPEFGNVFREMEDSYRRLQESIDHQLSEASDLFKSSSNFDPAKVQNKTVHDTMIKDGHVIETDEQVISSGTPDNGRVIRVKTVRVKPTPNPTDGAPSSSKFTPSIMEEKNEASHQIKDVELDMGNEVTDDETDIKPRSTVIDLSNDTRVNDRLSEEQEVSGLRMSEPDAELIDINSINNPKTNVDSQRYYYSTQE